MKKKHFIYLFVGVLLLTAIGCARLDVQNPNNPDTERVLARDNDLIGVTAGAFVSLYAPFGVYFINVNLEWTADYITMTNNVGGWWSEFKQEPRPQYNNTVANSNLSYNRVPYERWNAAISSANDVIRAIDVQGRRLSTGAQTEMVRAGAYFVRAMALGYLANTYNQAPIVSETADVTQRIEFSDYRAVLNAALVNFDTVIAICGRSTFTLAANFINTPVPYTSAQLRRLASTYAANFIAQNARTAAENAQTNWARVLAYTDNGMTQDYVITLDGINWNNGIQGIAGLSWYWRVDHRVIRLLDPTYPKRYPATGTLRQADSSLDARMRPSSRYFRYENDLSFFNLARGPQLRSHYRFARYDDLYNLPYPQPCTFLYAETNRLLRAEAQAMTGNLTGAISILNDPTGRRKAIGRLDDIPASATRDQVLDAIFKERELELMLTDFALHFKDNRRRDILQRGTVTMMPIPVTELNTLQLPVYTFGGVANAGQPGTASGARDWLNVLP